MTKAKQTSVRVQENSLACTHSALFMQSQVPKQARSKLSGEPLQLHCGYISAAKMVPGQPSVISFKFL